MQRSKQKQQQKPQKGAKATDSNPGGFLDQEIGYLESKLGAGSKDGADLLEKELKSTNLFELFTCVDHILGKKKGEKKHPQTREEYEQALREMDAAEAQEEEDQSGDLEQRDDLDAEEHGGDLEDGEDDGEEEFDQEDYGDEEDEEIEDVEEQPIMHQTPKPDSTKDALAKRKPDTFAAKELPNSNATEISNPESKVSAEKLQEIVKILLIKCRDNKELQFQVNNLCGSVHRLKLNGRDFAKATLLSLEIPANHKIPKPETKKEDKKKPTDDAKKAPKVKTYAPKLVDAAAPKDRLRSALYAVSMVSNKFASEFASAVLHQSTSKYSSWTLSGLFCLGLVKGRVLLDWLHMPGTIGSQTLPDLEKVIHLYGAPIRAKEPSLFKELSAQLTQLYPDGEVAATLKSHLEKLRHNLTLPGTTPFEVSNTTVKLFEKLQQKRRTDIIIPYLDLASLRGIAKLKTPNTPAASELPNSPASAQVASAGGKTSASAVVQKEVVLEPVLAKLADKLGLATRVEKLALQAVTSSPEFIEVVHKLLGMNTHGSENKELAAVVVKCCLQEKKYNPFYAAIAKKICSLKDMFKYSFQLAIWEEIRVEAEAEEAGEPTPGMMSKLGSFSWELMQAQLIDHRFFKFLDQDPLPKCSAILAKRLFEEMLASVPRELLRVFCKKLSKLDSVARNAQKVVRYIHKQREGTSPEEELRTLKRLESWLEYVPNFDEPEPEDEPTTGKKNKRDK